MNLRECLIRNPAVLLDSKTLENTLNDLYQNHKGKVRHMLTAYYQLDFQKVILNNSFSPEQEARFVLQLTTVYDIPRPKAVWVVEEWKSVLCGELSRRLVEALSRIEQSKLIDRTLSSETEQSSQTREEIIGQIVGNALLRAAYEMKQGNWAMAENLYDDILNVDIRNQEAWVGKLLCHRKVRSIEELASRNLLLDDDQDYQQALQFADKALAGRLRGCARSIRVHVIAETSERAAKALDQGLWDEAEKAYRELIRLDGSRTDARVGALLGHCRVRTAKELRTAPVLLQEDPLYQETVAHVDRRTAKRLERYANANRVWNSRGTAEKARLRAAARKKMVHRRRRAAALAVAAAVLALAGLAFLYRNVLVPQGGNNSSIPLPAGAADDAGAPSPYSGAQEEAPLTVEEMTERAVFSVGNTVVFGTYEQDNRTKNGKEPVQWIIADREGSDVLLVSRYALDVKQYHSVKTDVTWAKCALRAWLNGDFMSEAFTEEEQAAIVPTNVMSLQPDGYYNNGFYGLDTRDHVFLLSQYEISEYFPADSDRQLENTAYTRANGAEFGLIFRHGGEHCYWLTRTRGKAADEVVIVNESGSFDESKPVNDTAMAVRPALWLNTKSAAAKKLVFAVGSTVSFGHYGDESDGTCEPVRWIVTGKQDGRIILLSEKILDCRQFGNDGAEDITWENSTLRTWLNRDFVSSAFNPEERKALCTVRYILSADDGVPEYRNILSRELSDQVFLLSFSDVLKAFPDPRDRRAKTASYARKRGAEDGCCWWMISPGTDNVSEACIDGNGQAVSCGVTGRQGVRPAVMISETFGTD